MGGFSWCFDNSCSVLGVDGRKGEGVEGDEPCFPWVGRIASLWGPGGNVEELDWILV